MLRAATPNRTVRWTAACRRQLVAGLGTTSPAPGVGGGHVETAEFPEPIRFSRFHKVAQTPEKIGKFRQEPFTCKCLKLRSFTGPQFFSPPVSRRSE